MRGVAGSVTEAATRGARGGWPLQASGALLLEVSDDDKVSETCLAIGTWHVNVR